MKTQGEEMKKAFIILSVIALIFTFIACDLDGSQNPGGQPGNPGGEPENPGGGDEESYLSSGDVFMIMTPYENTIYSWWQYGLVITKPADNEKQGAVIAFVIEGATDTDPVFLISATPESVIISPFVEDSSEEIQNSVSFSYNEDGKTLIPVEVDMNRETGGIKSRIKNGDNAIIKDLGKQQIKAGSSVMMGIIEIPDVPFVKAEEDTRSERTGGSTPTI